MAFADFNAAKEFNKKSADGEADLEYAPVVDDIKEEADQDDVETIESIQQQYPNAKIKKVPLKEILP